MDNKEKLIKDAQFRKGLSIAFFNATNAAIELLKGKPKFSAAKFKELRDYFLKEHETYYAERIAKIGLFDAKETIAKLKATKTLDELRNVWLLLSEDERRDDEVVKVKEKLKAKYAKMKRLKI